MRQGATAATEAFRGMSLVKFAVFTRALKQINQLLTSVTDSLDEIQTSLAIIDNYNFSGANISQVADYIYSVSRDTRTEFQQTANTIENLLSTGIFQGDNAAINAVSTTEIINKAILNSGQTGNGAAQSAERLTSALSQGYLTASNIKSLLNTPKLADYIAEGFNELGYSVNATRYNLKELAKDGQLTADRIVNALHASAETINADFEVLPRRFSEIRTQFASTWQFVLTRLNDTNGPLQNINDQLGRIADWFSSSEAQPLFAAIALAAEGLAFALEKVVDFAAGFYNIITSGSPVVIGILTAIGTLVTLEIASGLAKATINMVKFGLSAAAAHPLVAAIAIAAGVGAFALAEMGVTGEQAFEGIGKAAGAATFSISTTIKGLVGLVGAFVLNVGAMFVDFVNGIRKGFDEARIAGDDLGGYLTAVFKDAFSNIINFGKSALQEFIIVAVDLLRPLAVLVGEGIFGDLLGGNSWVSKLDQVQNNASSKLNDIRGDNTISEVDKWRQTRNQEVQDLLNEINDPNYYNNPVRDILEWWTNTVDGWFEDSGTINEAIQAGGEAGLAAWERLNELLNSVDLNASTDTLEAILDSIKDLDLSEIDVVDEVGKINTDVNIADEDLKLLKDVATADYLNRINSINVTVDATFGDINTGDDGQDMIGNLVDQLEERLAVISV